MTPESITSFIAKAAGLKLGPAPSGPGVRFAMEGFQWQPGSDGAIDASIGLLQASGLRFESRGAVLDVGQVEIRDVKARLQAKDGSVSLVSLEAASAELRGVQLHATLEMPQSIEKPSVNAPVANLDAAHLSLAPLGTAEGSLRMDITDAFMAFDARVTVPIEHGQVDFSDASVEHVGPDSRMGVSKLGIYVDAPDGRSYLYQFASPPLEGVEFEQRGTLLGPWVKQRGKIWLQPFAEAMLRQLSGGLRLGLSEQARVLLGRTALSGNLKLGDGLAALAGLSAVLTGHDIGHNDITLKSQAVGQGLTAGVTCFSVRDLRFGLTAR